MTETYGVSVQVHVRQIVAPIGADEARIPALVRLPDERLFLFYDERPAPASGTGADFKGYRTLRVAGRVTFRCVGAGKSVF